MKYKVRTKPEQLTYQEQVLFQQWFGKIIYDIDVVDFANIKEQIYKELNENNIAKAILLLHNFDLSLQLLELGSDAWMVCYAILVEKPEIEKDSKILIEKYYDKNLRAEEVRDVVVNFSIAFPNYYLTYTRKAERLEAWTDLILKKS